MADRIPLRCRSGVSLAALLLSAGAASAQTAGTLTQLPFPPGATAATSSLVNRDGTVVAGGASYPQIVFTPPGGGASSNQTPNRPWRWTAAGGSVDLGPVNAFIFNGAAAIDLSGNTLVGSSSSPRTPATGWRWTSAGGYEILPLPVGAGTFGEAIGGITPRGVSGDGNVVVGATSVNIQRAFTWTTAGGYVNIGLPTGNASDGAPWRSSTAAAADGNGSAVAVTLFGAGSTTQRAARWTAAGGFQIIEPGAGFTRTNALRMSQDGLVVGGDRLGAGGAQEAIRWTAAGGLQGLGFVTNATFSLLTGMSASGDHIVGNSGRDGTGSFQTGFYWTSTAGMRSLDQAVTAANVNLNGLTLTRASGISGDGLSIVGAARTAGGQTVPYLLTFAQGAAPVESTSFSTTTRLTEVAASRTNTVASTLVTGVLGQSAVFSAAGNGTLAGNQAAVEAAREAIQAAAGLRRVSIGAPRSVGTQRIETGRSSTVQDVVTGQSQNTVTTVVNGPTLVNTGDLGECDTPATATSAAQGCSLPGGALIVAANRESRNTHTNTLRQVTRTTTTTVTETVRETFEVTGTPGNQMGTVHALAGQAAIELQDHFVRRLIDGVTGPALTVTGGEPATTAGVKGPSNSGRPAAPATPWFAFAEGFGQRGQTGIDVARGIAATRSTMSGLAAGIAAGIGPDLILGAGVQWGRTALKVREAAGPESLDIDLVQAAVFARWKRGDLYLNAAASAGTGSARTRITGMGAGDRQFSAFSAGIEAGHAFSLGWLTLTPHAGLRHSHVELGRLAETGSPLALGARRETVTGTRGHVGLALRTEVVAGTVLLQPRAYARLTHEFGDPSGRAAVFFVSQPATPLTALGPRVTRTGIEAGFGIDARLSAAVSAYAAYDARFRGTARDHSATAGLMVIW